MPSDGVVIHRRVKVRARANEVKCNNIVAGEPCGATVFWVTLLNDAIKIQCITCYGEQKLRGPGLKKAIKLLKASEKNKLLPVGAPPKKLPRGKSIDIIDSQEHHVKTEGKNENLNRNTSTGNSGDGNGT